mmetsp:Transcript_5873/g.13443  ORF Transcript_5873/g.13443 Transcript_5873/m.13443 type:complete len:228 (-) Transcript_5873:58-741(-)
MAEASSRLQQPPPVRQQPAMMCARSPVGMGGPLVTPKTSAWHAPEPKMSPRLILGGASRIQDCMVKWGPAGWNMYDIWSARKISILFFCSGSFTVSILRSDRGWRVTEPPSLSMRYMQQSFRRLMKFRCFSTMFSSSMSSSLSGSGVSALSSRLLAKGSQHIDSVRPVDWKPMLSQVIGPMTANRLVRSISYWSSSDLGMPRCWTSSSLMSSRGSKCEILPLPLRPR